MFTHWPKHGKNTGILMMIVPVACQIAQRGNLVCGGRTCSQIVHFSGKGTGAVTDVRFLKGNFQTKNGASEKDQFFAHRVIQTDDIIRAFPDAELPFSPGCSASAAAMPSGTQPDATASSLVEEMSLPSCVRIHTSAPMRLACNSYRSYRVFSSMAKTWR